VEKGGEVKRDKRKQKRGKEEKRAPIHISSYATASDQHHWRASQPQGCCSQQSATWQQKKFPARGVHSIDRWRQLPAEKSWGKSKN